MSIMRQPNKVIAILCSDIHLSQNPPRARREESSWFNAMSRPLKELKSLSEEHQAPILCAGDIFHHWNAVPELISFAIEYLPEMYAIPGQHDLPFHNIELIHRSAYWTMVVNGRIYHIQHKKPKAIENNIVVHAFPFGTTIKPFEKKSKKFHIAICHQYFWTGVHCFPNAPEERESSAYKNKIKGYHAVAFGDNHKGFKTRINGIEVLNCGGFTRRNIDEEKYEPQVGLLCENGKIIIHKLCTEHEKFLTAEEEKIKEEQVLLSFDMEDLKTEIEDLQSHSFDFFESLKHIMVKKKTRQGVRQLVMHSLGNKKG